MPSVGSSSTSRRGRVDQRAADGELLLLAAGKVAAAPVQHVLQHGEEIEDLVGHIALGRAERRDSRSRDSPCTVSSGKISRPCGT